MEIAQVSIRRNPHSINLKTGLTPAEVLLVHAIHFKNAQGSPLGDDFRVTGIAETTDSPGKPAEDETFNAITGHRTPATPAVPARKHKRTNPEEVARLKKVYQNARVRLEDGSEQNAFVAVFGAGVMPKLPETFDEIEEAVGMTFPPLSHVAPADPNADERNALLAKPRHQLVRMALDNKVQVAVADDNASIVDAIIEATRVQKVAVTKGVDLDKLNKPQLLSLVAERGIEGVTPDSTKAELIAALTAAG